MKANEYMQIATPEAARAEMEYLVNTGRRAREAEETPQVVKSWAKPIPPIRAAWSA